MGSPAGRVLRTALVGQRRWTAPAAVLIAGHQVGEALVPVLIGVIIDRAVATGDGSALVAGLVALAVVFLVFSYCYRFGARCGERAAELAAHELRLALTRRVLAPYGGAERGRLSGELAAVATEDTQQVGMLNQVVPHAVAATAGLAVGTAALLRVSTSLGLLVLLGTVPVLGLGYLAARPLERRSSQEQDRAARAAGLAADLVAGLRVLKGLGAGPAASDRYRVVSRDALAATMRSTRAEAGHGSVAGVLTGLFVAGIALAGGWQAVRGEISVGGLVAAVGLALFLLGPLSMAGWLTAEWARGRASAARIATVLAAAPAVTGGSALPAGPGALRFDGLDLDVPAGQLLGVATTEPADLLAVLGREREPDGVHLDGTDLRRYDLAAARAAVLVAGHEATLLDGSLADNVRTPAASPATVAAAMAAANADEVAGTLPDGADTPLTERGRSLSGGQRQRVALARALAADPPVLVLHEPTTAVDPVTEARIAADVRALRAGRTTILVTTGPALLAVCDRVVLLAEGRVAADGTHAALLDDHAGYRELVLG